MPDECDISGTVVLLQDHDGLAFPPEVGVSMSGLWHVGSSCQPPGSCGALEYAYFGIDATCSFNALPAPAGRYELAGVALPVEDSITLEFCSYYQGEEGCQPWPWGWDTAQVFVRTAVGLETLVDYVSCGGATGAWERRQVDLTPFAGQVVDLVFHFAAEDEISNHFFGWAVDDVRVVARAAGPDRDTNGNGVLDACEHPDRFCFGDGSEGPCPCGNESAPGAEAGCRHSQGAGATLRALGAASLSDDTLVLHGASMPNQPVLYFQGASMHAPIPFGDGIKCTGGPFVRLGVKPNANGASVFPGPNDLPISVRGMISGPTTRYYQARYRDPAAFCTTDTFNYTNAVAVVWGP